jgi:hypothetical protein
MVIIDNRHDRQQIAIQKNTAFSKQTRVAEILQEAFSERMKRHKLVVDINARYEVREFWKIINKNPTGVRSLKFTFTPRNLPWLAGNVKRLFNDLGDEFHGLPELEMKSLDKVPLVISSDSAVLKEFLDVSSASGMPIIICFFNTKTPVTCGKKTCIMISLDKRVINKIDKARLATNDEIPEKVWEAIIECVNENKILNS